MYHPKRVRTGPCSACTERSFPDLTPCVSDASGPERRLELGKKLHSSVDVLQTPTYSRFLKAFFPVFSQLLNQLPVQQQPETAEHKLRRLVVDVLQRLPQNETVKPYIHELLRLALQVIRTDNEENALICMHIFSDVFRAHKPQDPDSAMSFLEFVKGVRCCVTLRCVLTCNFVLPPAADTVSKGYPCYCIAVVVLWSRKHLSLWQQQQIAEATCLSSVCSYIRTLQRRTSTGLSSYCPAPTRSW